MNFLKRKTSWINMELGLIKAYLSSAGMIAAIYLYESLKNILPVLWMMCVITFVWSGYLWIKKTNESQY